jgi:hypothetical protein
MTKKLIKKINNQNNLNIDELKQTMLKEMYILEATLFNQASLENKRISQLREIVSTLESMTFTKENMQELPTEYKISAYKSLTSDLYNSLNFITKLHQNVNKGFELLSEIEKSQNQEQNIPQVNNKEIENIKNLLINEIKKKIREK